MSKFAFDPSEATRWFIPIPKPLPPLEAGAFDEPTNCFGINIEWMIMVIVCADILADHRAWEEASPDQLNFIQQQVGRIQSRLLRATDCGDTEECPDPVIMRQYNDEGCYRVLVDDVPKTDWICPATPTENHQLGVMSDTNGEEEMACINIAAGLKVEGGILYAKNDCCDWVQVGNISALAGAAATAPQTFGAVADLAGGVASLVNSLPTLTPYPHATPEFNNEYTRKCLKATALKYVLQTLLTDSLDALEQVPNGTSAVLSAITLFLKITPLADIALVTGFMAWITEFGADFLNPLIEEIIADDEIWDEFVCDFAPIMTTAETFTGQDVANFYAKAVTYTALFAEWFLSLLNRLIPLNFQANVNEWISAVNCECPDYLPYGYTPPVPEGVIHFLQMASTGAGNSINAWQLEGGAPNFIDINLTPVGAKSGDNFTTVDVGSGTYYYQGLGILLLVPDDVLLTDLTYTMTLSGTTYEVKLRVTTFLPGTGWVDGGAQEFDAAGTHTLTGHFPGAAGYTHLLVQLKGSAPTAGPTIAISNLLFSGSIGGTSFTDKALEESLV